MFRRNFGLGVLANFLLCVALYGSVFILPVYLARVQGYNSERIGMVLARTGLPQLVLIPLVPQLMKRIDPRIMIGTPFQRQDFDPTYALARHVGRRYN